MADELAFVGKLLGKEAPGIDPLDAHADLQQRVQNGELDRRDALEITQLRQAQLIRNAQAQQTTQTSTKQQGIDAAVRGVEQLSVQLKAADPHFDARWPILAPQVKLICEAFPPEQWAQRIATAHAGLPPYVPPTPIRQAATPVMRPGGAATMDRKPQNDLEAFDMGLQRMQG